VVSGGISDLREPLILLVLRKFNFSFVFRLCLDTRGKLLEIIFSGHKNYFSVTSISSIPDRNRTCFDHISGQFQSVEKGSICSIIPLLGSFKNSVVREKYTMILFRNPK